MSANMQPGRLAQPTGDGPFAVAWYRLKEWCSGPSQHPEELEWLTNVIRGSGCRSLLEIGARTGGSLYLLAQSLPRGARVVAVDLPGGQWGATGSESVLSRTQTVLREEGYAVDTVLGDSHAPQTIAAVRKLVPEGFDAVFVDGDHSYDGAAADVANFMPMVRSGGLMALHDIWPRAAEPDIQVPRLWVELLHVHPWGLCVATADSPGIGVLFKPSNGDTLSRPIQQAAAPLPRWMAEVGRNKGSESF